MTTSTPPVEERALVGIPQIAQIAKVGRSAVGNWRKRHPDFPAAKVQAPSGALFDLREVEDWLIEHDKISERAPASARLRGIAGAARDIWSPQDFMRFSVGFLVYLEACARASGEDSSRPDLPSPQIPAGADWSHLRNQLADQFLRAFSNAARSIEEVNPELEDLLDIRLEAQGAASDQLAFQIALTLEEAGTDASSRRALFEALTDLESRDRFSGEFSTPADVARLLSDLVEFRGGTVVDPAVGTGRLLWETAFDSAQDTPASGHNSIAIGIDINREATRRTRSRFYLYGRRAEIRNENALAIGPNTLPKADVVVADPPLGLSDWGHADLYVDPRWQFGSPSPRSADFAWLQFVSQQLKPTGRAAVLMAAGSLISAGRDGGIRQRMVEAGVVEAIIALPPRLRTNTSIPLAVWLLRSPAAPIKPEHVLLVDASKLGDSGRSRFSLPAHSIDRISDLVSRWRKTQRLFEEGTEIAASVRAADILEADANLNPAIYRERVPLDIAELETAVVTLRQSLRASSDAASKARQKLLSYLESRA